MKLYYVKTTYISNAERYANKLIFLAEQIEYKSIFEKGTKTDLQKAEKYRKSYQNILELLYRVKAQADGYICKANWNDLQKLKEINLYIESR